MKSFTVANRQLWITAVSIFLCSIAIYWQTVFFDFVWDDYGVIIHNSKIRSITAAVTTFYRRAGSNIKYDPSQMTANNWRPLRTLTHAVVYRFFKLNPFWYHLLNIFFHALVAVMLFLILARMTGDITAAAVGALLFALHPVNTEAVCWAKSLEDLMATFFMLSAWFMMLNFRPIPQKFSVNICLAVGAVLAFALSVTAKLSVIFFPLFILLFILLRYWRWDNSAGSFVQRWTIASAGVMLLLAGGGIITRLIVLDKVAQCNYITGDCWTTWLSMPRLFLRYLRIELLPWPFFADYSSYPHAVNLADSSSWIYTVAFILIFIAISLLLYRRRLLGPWLWFWLALLPFSNIIAMKQLGAERFLYIPTIAVAWLGAELFRRVSTSIENDSVNIVALRMQIIVALVLLLFACLTLQRSLTWNNEISLWETTVGQFPNSERPRQNLIKVYVRLKNLPAALQSATDLVRQFPTPANSVLFGYTLCLNRQYRQGIAILLANKAPDILNNAGAVAAGKGDLATAEYCFSLATSLVPSELKYRHNLALIKLQRRHLQTIKQHCRH